MPEKTSGALRDGAQNVRLLWTQITHPVGLGEPASRISSFEPIPVWVR
jgi:hypothetical protein